MRAAAALYFLLLFAWVPAHAEWLTVRKDNPFDNVTQVFVYQESENGVLGFRCAGPDVAKASLIFVVPEMATPEQAARVSQRRPQVSLIIDDLPRVDLPAATDTVAVLGVPLLRLLVSGGAVLPVLESMAAARTRIAVAMSLAGRTLYPDSFDVDGSREALAEALGTCKLPRLKAGS